MQQHSGNSSSIRSSAQNNASKELADLISRYNTQHETKIDPTLNELLYVVVRLSDSIRQDPKHTGGWTDLVREVKRRLYGHLNSGHGYQQSNPPEDTTP